MSKTIKLCGLDVWFRGTWWGFTQQCLLSLLFTQHASE